MPLELEIMTAYIQESNF